MKIRMFSKLLVALVLLPAAAYSAIAFENYQSIVVPQLRKYPNYGFFYSFHLGFNNVTSFDLSPEGTKKVTETIMVDMMEVEVVTEVDVDVPDPKIKLEDGFMAGGTLGFRNKNFRTEAELSVRFNSSKSVRDLQDCPPDDNLTIESDGDVIVGSLLINLYWDYLIGSYFVPFVGAGIGGAFMSNSVSATLVGGDPDMAFSKPEFSENGIGLAWQLMIGGAIILNDHSEIGLVYKFFQARPGTYSNKKFAVECDDMDLTPIDVEFSPTYTAQTLSLEWRIHP